MPARGRRSVLTRYGKRGGVAGIDQELTVFTDGQAELIDVSRGERRTAKLQVAPDHLDRLREALDQADFSFRADRLLPDPAPADAMYFSVTRGMRSVTTTDRADLGPVPDVLDKLILQALDAADPGQERGPGFRRDGD